MSRNPRAIGPWLLMLLMLGAATALRVALEPVLGDRFPLLTYYPMTVFLALFAGPWPAAAGVAASAVLSETLFAPDHVTQADLVALAIYVPTNVLLIVLVERVRRTSEGARHRERAARRSETSSVAHRGLLATALESVDAGVHSWDPTSGEAQWDTRLRSLFGFDLGEPATHVALLDRVHPDDRRRVEDALADAAALVGPRRYSLEYRIFRGVDGALRWMVSAGFAVFEGDKLVRFVGTVRDITDQHRVEAALRESERRFATLAEGSPVLLWVNGLEGGEFVNRAYLEFLGVQSNQEVRGYDWSRFLHPADRDEYLNAYRRAFATRTRFTAEFRFRRYDGEYRWMRSDATPRFGEHGELEGYVGATVDITERRNAEDALRVADRHKDEFLAMLAHELRNPLAPIRNASEVLALRYGDDPQAAGPIAMLRRQSDHLARLLDDLLDVTRIAQGRVILKHEPLEIGAVVDQAVETVTPLAQGEIAASTCRARRGAALRQR